MYTIKHAAEVTGLSPATLRAWERRYGVVTPHRTEAGYRLYDEEAVRTLLVMAALVEQGGRRAQAAEETRRAGSPRASRALRLRPSTGIADMPRPKAELAPEPAAHATVDEAAAKSLARRAGPSDSRRAGRGSGRAGRVRLTATLDERFSLSSFESVVDGWLMPSLVALGEAWAEGRVSVAGEHLASHTVMRRLAAAYDASSSGGDRGADRGGHCRPDLATSWASWRSQWRRAALVCSAAYVGADLPTADWVTAVVAHQRPGRRARRSPGVGPSRRSRPSWSTSRRPSPSCSSPSVAPCRHVRRSRACASVTGSVLGPPCSPRRSAPPDPADRTAPIGAGTSNPRRSDDFRAARTLPRAREVPPVGGGPGRRGGLRPKQR